MSVVRFIGDVHGKFDRYHNIIKDAPCSIQVGDMGVGFPGLGSPKTAGTDHYFIRGNHDNPATCKVMRQWILDGSIMRGVYCLGGASSIDRAYRTEGVTWWPDEELSYNELQIRINDYAILKPDVVCTHECPESIANEIITRFCMPKIDCGSRTRPALERMFSAHKPRLWIFGHWHVSARFERDGTIFQCLNELEYVDVET